MKNQVNLFYDIVNHYKIPMIEKVDMLIGILKDFPYSIKTSDEQDKFILDPCENDFYYFYMETQSTCYINVSQNSETPNPFQGYLLESLEAYQEDISILQWIVEAVNSLEIKEDRKYLIARFGYNLKRSEIENKLNYSIKKQHKSEDNIAFHFTQKILNTLKYERKSNEKKTKK